MVKIRKRELQNLPRYGICEEEKIEAEDYDTVVGVLNLWACGNSNNGI